MILKASAAAQTPALSSPFPVSAGRPASVVQYVGSNQAAQVLQPFPLALQALVSDAGGNPVSGVAVTFAVPGSGPSGTFSDTPSAVTGPNGIATAPTLTANATAGTFLVTATAAGLGTPALFSLTNTPASTGNLQLDQTQLLFGSEIGQPAPPPQLVQISSSGSPSDWTASSTAP